MGKDNNNMVRADLYNSQNEQGQINELESKSLQYNQQHSNQEENEQEKFIQNEQSKQDQQDQE